MSNNDWTNKLRERMADYQEPVDHDLWAGIEQSLAQGNVSSTSRLIHVRRWMSAAAAVALLAVGGSYVYLQQGDLQPNQTVRIDSNHGGRMARNLPTLKSVGVEAKMAQVGGMNMGEKTTLLAMASPSQRMDDTLPSAAQPGLMEVAEADAQDDSPVTSTGGKVNSAATSYVPAAVAAAVMQEKRKGTKKVGCDVTLFAENGVITSNNSSASYPYMVASSPVQYPDVFFDESAEPFDALLKVAHPQVAQHHAPVAVGAQVGIRVTPRLSLTTGAVYTRTSSDISHDGGNTYDTKQTLHYVGIPLGVNYEVWGTKNLHTYVMAGAEVDFNVKNHTEAGGVKLEEGVSKDRAQFSAKASLGVQYDVVPQLGVYVEPGTKYYFDNGSEIENTFKDKKLNFNLQVGLRWNIGK